MTETEMAYSLLYDFGWRYHHSHKPLTVGAIINSKFGIFVTAANKIYDEFHQRLQRVEEALDGNTP
jgi:hypothetical protein